ncbi:GNAT family N-acetyltransferase [Paenibacillus xylanilyticus]|nr:GNAT family N-acetyltransferase [Paenibacillus xylanilyticus]
MMFEIVDIRQKPDMLQAAVQYFWNSRQDLFPWFACLHVEPEYRGQNLGGQLQNHAMNEAKAKGYDKLYLCTDLTDYYEKHNWAYIGKGYLLDDAETRIYELQI